MNGYHLPYSGNPAIDPWIAADFEHALNNYGRGLSARVCDEDFIILMNYYHLPTPADCLP